MSLDKYLVIQLKKRKRYPVIYRFTSFPDNNIYIVHILYKLFNLIKQFTQVFYYYKYPLENIYIYIYIFCIKIYCNHKTGENGEIKVTLDSTKNDRLHYTILF